MILADSEIKEILKKPLYKGWISDAVSHQQLIDAYANGSGSDIIWAKYRQLLPSELSDLIGHYFVMASKEFLAQETGTVYSHFDKINNTQEGKSVRLSFDNPNDIADYTAYIKGCFMSSPGKLNGISDFNFFGHQAIIDAVYAPNTRYVVDLPSANSENEIGGVMPYVVRVPIESIHDLMETDRGTEYFIVKQRWGKLIGKTEPQYIPNESQVKDVVRDIETRYYVYASDRFTVWREEDSKRGQFELISASENTFGCVPVRAASSYNKDSGNYLVKKSVISDSLGSLFWYNLVWNMNTYFKGENMIPKTVQVAAECDEPHPESGEMCGGRGFFLVSQRDARGNIALNDSGGTITVRKNCRKCEERRKQQFTFGKRIQLRYADWKEQPNMVANLDKSFGYIVAPDGSLKYNDATIDAMRNQILSDITGEVFNSQGSKEDFSEAYLSLATDDRQNNLSRFATHIENLHAWFGSRIAEMRYPSFVSMSVNYGRTYFFKSVEMLLKELVAVNEKTGDVCLFLEKSLELARTRYKNDPAQLEMYQIISACVPFSDIPLPVVLENKAALEGTTEESKIAYQIRIYSTSLIREFMLTDASKILLPEKTNKEKIIFLKRWLSKRVRAMYDTSQPQSTEGEPGQAIAANLSRNLKS